MKNITIRLPALIAALLLPVTAPLLLGTALSTAALLVIQAQAQSSEAAAKAAQAITVRIEGATQGSGVLVKREDNRYSVLTAWHVVSGQSKGEELDIFVRDGSRQQLEQGNIKRLGEVDLAALTFSSINSYEVAQVSDIKSVSMGNPIWVSGFPLPSSAVSTRLMRFIKGDVIANATVAIPDGYQLLYDNQTLPGVSGGAMINNQLEHLSKQEKSKRINQVSESSGKAVAKGTNQGLIVSYRTFSSGTPVIASIAQAITADDYLERAKGLLWIKGKENELIQLADKAIALREDATAFWLRARAKKGLGDISGSVEDWSRAVALQPDSPWLHYNLAGIKSDYGDKPGAINAYREAIFLLESIKTRHGDQWEAQCSYGSRGCLELLGDALYSRAKNLGIVGDYKAAMVDFSQLIYIAPNDGMRGSAYEGRAEIHFRLGNINAARADCRQAVNLVPNELLSKSRSNLLNMQSSTTTNCAY